MMIHDFTTRLPHLMVPVLLGLSACSPSASPSSQPGGNGAASASHMPAPPTDLSSPPTGPKVKAEAKAIREMLQARFGRLVRGVRVRVEGTGNDVRVQLRGDVPSEQAREAVTREVAARVEGIRVQDFDLTISGPAPLIGMFETPVGHDVGVYFTRDLRIAAVLDENPMGMPEILDLWAGRRINKLASVERQALKVLAISPDGKQFATGHMHGMIVLWQLPLGEKPVVLEKARDINSWNAPAALAFSPDGRMLAYVLSDGGEVWLRSLGDTGENRLLGKLDPKLMGYYLAFSPDGQLLASADQNGAKVVLWDVKARTRKRELPLSQVFVETMTWSPDGKALAIGRSTGEAGILLLDVESGKGRVLGLSQSSSILNIAFTPDGKTLAARLSSAGVVLWDATTDKEWTRLDGDRVGDGRGLAFSADGSVLATGHAGAFNRKDDPSGIQFWDVSNRPGADGTGGEFPPTRFEPYPGRDDFLASQILERVRAAPGMRKAPDASVEILADGSVRLTGTVPAASVRDSLTRDIEMRFPMEGDAPGKNRRRKVINEMRVGVGS